MRRHENIGYDAFNTYRSGDENSRRYDYGSSESNERGGSSVYGRSSRDTGASDHNFSSEPGFYGSGYSSGNRSQQPNPTSQNQSNYDSNRYSQIRPQNQSNWGSQNQSNQYGNRNSYNSPSDNYRNENRSSWQNRSSDMGNRMENWADRAEDRIERWGDKISNAWDRWTDEDNNQTRNQVRQNWMNRPDDYPTYSHGNAYSNRYSENYDNNAYGNTGYGNRNSYENRDNYRRNRDDDGGFFDNLGNRISNAWDRWVGDDSDEERRYQERSRRGSSGNTTANYRSNNSFGPSRGEYEW